jgi:hypothetical protein
MKKWQVLGRHNGWVAGAKITESMLIDSVTGFRRYTATIRGWTNFHIWQGDTYYKDMKERIEEIKRRVEVIKERIDKGDESVFAEKGAW